MKIYEIIEDLVNRNISTKQWQLRSDDTRFKNEESSTALLNASVYIDYDAYEAGKNLFAFIQGNKVNIDKPKTDGRLLGFQKDLDKPFYYKDTKEAFDSAKLVYFNQDGSVVAYDELKDDITETVDDSNLINKIANGVAKWMYQNEPAEYPVQTIGKMTGLKDTVLSKTKITFDYLKKDTVAEYHREHDGKPLIVVNLDEWHEGDYASIAEYVAHELRHALDDLKFKGKHQVSYWAGQDKYQRPKVKDDPYWSKPSEINARVQQALHNVDYIKRDNPGASIKELWPEIKDMLDQLKLTEYPGYQRIVKRVLAYAQQN